MWWHYLVGKGYSYQRQGIGCYCKDIGKKCTQFLQGRPCQTNNIAVFHWKPWSRRTAGGPTALQKCSWAVGLLDNYPFEGIEVEDFLVKIES